MTDLKIGEAKCQSRVENIPVGDYLYTAGIVHLQSGNVLIVRRVPQAASACTPPEIVSPDEIPRQVTSHPQIARWNDVGFIPAGGITAKALIEGELASYWQPSLGSGLPMFGPNV